MRCTCPRTHPALPSPISKPPREVRHAYGRTALLLSGGGSLGSFHIVSSFWRLLSLVVLCVSERGCEPCKRY